MGAFNFSPNNNTMLNFDIDSFIDNNYYGEVDRYELSDVVYSDMADYEEAISDYIHDGLSKIWDKYYDYLSSDDVCSNFDEFEKIIFIQHGYHEGFCVCIENLWYIDTDIARRDDIMKDIIEFYKTLPEQFSYLVKTKHCGWAGQQDSDWFFEWRPMNLKRAKEVFLEELNNLEFNTHSFITTDLCRKWSSNGKLVPSELYALEQTSFYDHLSDLYKLDKELEVIGGKN